MPKAEDITLDLQDLSLSIREKYLSANQTTLATLWIDLVSLSKILGTTIHKSYCLQDSLPTMEEVKKYDTQIMQVDSGLVDFDADQITTFHKHILQTFQG